MAGGVGGGAGVINCEASFLVWLRLTQKCECVGVGTINTSAGGSGCAIVSYIHTHIYVCVSVYVQKKKKKENVWRAHVDAQFRDKACKHL